MKLTLEIVELSAQKPTKSRTCEVLLEDNYLKYFIDFDSENLVNPEDELLGWTDQRNYLEVYTKKSCISAIEKMWNPSQNKWQIDIVIQSGSDIRLFFDIKAEKEADRILQAMLDWWLN